jgi:FAD/FMN-containing dehydrogenase
VIQQANWGICQATNAGCPISLSSSGIIDANCAQGSLAGYYIDVQRPSDVQEALKFANRYGIQVVIKSTGHDYLGRSTAPHALSLWMHNYQPPITLTQKFVPEGCSAVVGKVVTFGAGQQFEGIYKFADENKVTVVGGSGGTVGAAGGWISGGGHGMLSPVFGLGVDNVQQFKVVLPNGTLVTANRCKNPDVFFALRGGGGGTFGVVMEMSTTAHPQQTLQVIKPLRHVLISLNSSGIC